MRELEKIEPKWLQMEASARELAKPEGGFPSVERREVVVTDVRMPFWSMVKFMVKWSIAAIPAMIILSIVLLLVVVSTVVLLGGFGTLMDGYEAATQNPAKNARKVVPGR